MYRIRVIRDSKSAANVDTMTQIRDIMRKQFPLADADEIEQVIQRLNEPMVEKFQPLLIVAEHFDGKVLGFGSLLLFQPLRIAHLEFISTSPNRSGGGLGAMLYERLREECSNLGCIGLLFECLPDDEGRTSDPKILQQNVQRMRFYERFDARPILNSSYESPDKDGKWGPYLMLDQLDQIRPLGEYRLGEYVPEFLQYKYPDFCTRQELNDLAQSFSSDAIALRPPRYIKKPVQNKETAVKKANACVLMVVNDKHQIHHVRDRGYVEAPVRIPKILDSLRGTHLFEEVPAKKMEDKHLFAVHDRDYVKYLQTVCLSMRENQSIYPAIFPIRNVARPPKDMAMRAGYYCIDTFTPLNRNAYLAARSAVDCVLTCVHGILDGRMFAYALVRPPGHHAERRAFGGFCYFNSTAVAAHYLSRYGRVAVLDVDYHHGNGTQNIFYERSDVYTLSIHGDPKIAYPFFSGFADETGKGEGKGYNVNLPLPEKISITDYQKTLKKALKLIRKFKPDYLVIALGLDPAKSDPTGSWNLEPKDFFENGRLIAELKLPLLVVQEGGYRTRTLGANAKAFWEGVTSQLSVD